MKEFAVYTLMRFGLFGLALVAVAGVWSIFGDVPWIWAVVLAFLLSGAVSFVVLDPQRERFAARVEARAAKATAAFEARRAKEDEEAEQARRRAEGEGEGEGQQG